MCFGCRTLRTKGYNDLARPHDHQVTKLGFELGFPDSCCRTFLHSVDYQITYDHLGTGLRMSVNTFKGTFKAICIQYYSCGCSEMNTENH